MIVFGFDPGTNLGWAVCNDQKIIAHGTKILDQGAVGYGLMFLHLRDFLGQLRDKYTATYPPSKSRLMAMAYETPFHRGGITSRITWGIAAHIQELAAEWNCRVATIMPSSLKKFATSSGKSDKLDMIRAACQMAGMQEPKEWSKKTIAQMEHECDAIWVAGWAHKTLFQEAHNARTKTRGRR